MSEFGVASPEGRQDGWKDQGRAVETRREVKSEEVVEVVVVRGEKGGGVWFGMRDQA